jgi:hypothetical protein
METSNAVPDAAANKAPPGLRRKPLPNTMNKNMNKQTLKPYFLAIWRKA